MRRTTVSDTPIERQIYERAALDEERFLVDHLRTLLPTMETPPGWRRRHDKPGRPRKATRRGRKTEYAWQPMAIVLALMAFWESTRRETRARLRNSPDLRARIGLAKAPSPRTLGRAFDRFNTAWLRQLNRKLVASAQRGRGVDRPTSIAGWTVPG